MPVLINTPVVVDFESYAIEDGTPAPPKPIGVSIQYPNEPAHYYAWGHRTKNNCTFEDAEIAIKQAWAYPHGLCFHNLGFDVPLAEYYFKVPRLPIVQYHDTKILAFLLRPDDSAHGLKDLAADLLDMPPEEQDAVADWLEANAKKLGIKVSRAKKSDDYFAKHYHLVPGDLLGAYAEGDTIRTMKLWEKFFKRFVVDHERIEELGELITEAYGDPDTRLLNSYETELACLLEVRNLYSAYQREIEASLILADMRYTGMRVNTADLKRDIDLVEKELHEIDAWFYEFFNHQEVNLNAPAQVIDALLAANRISEDQIPRTKTGKLSGSAAALNALLPNSLFAGLYGYRMKLNKYLGTFMLPWHEQASKNNGFVYTSWVPVRTESNGASSGTRTGRISSTPNFQNIPRTIEQGFFSKAHGDDKPDYPFHGEPFLPDIRGYVIPSYDDHTFIDVDYSQQEIRVLAHFEDDELLRAYKENPHVDIHDYASKLISSNSAVKVTRTFAKMINFTLLYGGGAPILAQKLGISIEDATSLRYHYFKAFPGISVLNEGLKKRAYSNVPFFTLGGRRYYAIHDGYGYKCHLMLNTLIQGSSADMSKQALIDFNRIKDKRTLIILTVHDEFLVSTPKEIVEQEAEKLVHCMEQQRCDAPLIAECVHSKNTWAECKAA